MRYYIVLAIVSAVLAGFALLLWRKTRNLAFPIGLGLMYYLTLYGGWFVVYDKRGGDSGKHYHYLEDRLFPVRLDDAYFAALLWYGLFLVLLAAFTLMLVKRDRIGVATSNACLRISHWPIVGASGLCAIASYLLIRDGLAAAIASGEPVYGLMKRGLGDVTRWFTVHQIALRLAVVPPAIGVAVALSGERPRLICGDRSWLALALYGLILGGSTLLAFLLGYKSEIFVPALTGGLFYLTNVRNRNLLGVVLVGAAAIIGMWLVDTLRFLPLDRIDLELLLDMVGHLDEATAFVTSSNEAFAGHLSMYGALAMEIPLTFGSSLWSFVASIVPRAIWEDRPADIYAYYADSVMAEPGQGYTINHATAWYLNLGPAGVVFGALLCAWVWAKFFNLCLRAPGARHRLLGIAWAIAPFTFTSYIPSLFRAGPEVYKGLLVEALLLPSIILALGAVVRRPVVGPASQAVQSV